MVRFVVGAALCAVALWATTQAASAQERAYELVSPADKGGGQVDLLATTFYATIQVAPDGEAIAYPSFAPIAPTSSGAAHQQLVSRRDPEAGWASRSVSAPLGPTHGVETAKMPVLSEDLAEAIVDSNLLLDLDATPFSDSTGLYLQDHSGDPIEYTLLNEPSAPPTGPGNNRPVFWGATPDLGRVVFRSDHSLLPGMPSGLYEWANGELRFVPVMPDGVPSNGPAGVGANHNTAGAESSYQGGHAVSADGSRLYFTISAGADAGLYLRENGAGTKVVSASERAGDDPRAPTTQARFLLATADGSEAFFSSPHTLTDDATADGGSRRDLYLWRADAPVGERLTDLTTQDPAGAGVIGEVGADDAATHVYFVATGVLAPEAAAGANNLYLWRRGHGVRHVATLDAADDAVWGVSRGSSNNSYRDARVSANGERLLFASRAELTGHETAGHRQIYLYDTPSGDLHCVSCQTGGGPSTSDAALFDFPAGGGSPIRPLVLPANLSADGRRAYFHTAEALVRRDVNGRLDVYEWEDGELRLISDGESAHDARFIGASDDGEDVFFATRARLVGADLDGAVDVYDARVGGGFAEPPGPEPCAGDECQGPPSTPPPPSDPGSSALEGDGNADGVRRCMRLESRYRAAERDRRLASKSERRAARTQRRAQKQAKRASGGRKQRALRRARRAASQKRAARKREARGLRSARAARNAARSAGCGWAAALERG